jgi:hypothetical protein
MNFSNSKNNHTKEKRFKVKTVLVEKRFFQKKIVETHQRLLFFFFYLILRV